MTGWDIQASVDITRTKLRTRTPVVGKFAAEPRCCVRLCTTTKGLFATLSSHSRVDDSISLRHSAQVMSPRRRTRVESRDVSVWCRFTDTAMSIELAGSDVIAVAPGSATIVIPGEEFPAMHALPGATSS
jgi:hypothetical protein